MATPIKLSNKTVHYSITADAHPNALPCVMEIFYLHDIIPDLVMARKYSQKGNPGVNICIDIHVKDLALNIQEIISHKLAAQISVQNIREEIIYQKPRAKLAS